MEMEKIIGGYPALRQEFPYQAALVGLYSKSYHRHFLCNAGILTDYLLITATKCLMVTLRRLKRYTFFVVVGIDILTSTADLKEIDVFYRYHHSQTEFSSDLSIPKLKVSLNLLYHPELIPLQIPNEEETFHGMRGIVAGFGIDLIDDIYEPGNPEFIRYTTSRGLFLNKAEVLMTTDAAFRLSNGSIETKCRYLHYPFDEICGKILPDGMYTHRGVCRGDHGAPLVVGTKVVGIATIHNADCNDADHGTIYTRVGKFKAFINAIINNVPLYGTITFYNLPREKKTKSKISAASPRFTN